MTARRSAAKTSPAARIDLSRDRLLNSREASRLVGLSAKTLRAPGGPPTIKLGGARQARRLYSARALEQWVVDRAAGRGGAA